MLVHYFLCLYQSTSYLRKKQGKVTSLSEWPQGEVNVYMYVHHSLTLSGKCNKWNKIHVHMNEQSIVHDLLVLHFLTEVLENSGRDKFIQLEFSICSVHFIIYWPHFIHIISWSNIQSLYSSWSRGWLEYQYHVKNLLLKNQDLEQIVCSLLRIRSWNLSKKCLVQESQCGGEVKDKADHFG